MAIFSKKKFLIAQDEPNNPGIKSLIDLENLGSQGLFGWSKNLITNRFSMKVQEVEKNLKSLGSTRLADYQIYLKI